MPDLLDQDRLRGRAATIGRDDRLQGRASAHSGKVPALRLMSLEVLAEGGLCGTRHGRPVSARFSIN